MDRQQKIMLRPYKKNNSSNYLQIYKQICIYIYYINIWIERYVLGYIEYIRIDTVTYRYKDRWLNNIAVGIDRWKVVDYKFLDRKIDRYLEKNRQIATVTYRQKDSLKL